MNKKTHFFFICLITFFSFFIFADITKAYSNDLHSEDWFLDDINAGKGWKYLTDTANDFSKETIVAVIDTGCDYTHPLINSALWVNTEEKNGIPGVDDDNNGYVDDIYGTDIYNNDSDPMDDSVSSIKGHGTHVAGTILRTAGVTTDSNPFNIKIMIIKAGDSYGNFSADNIAKALYYAVDNGASVINMSFSTTRLPSSLRNALEYASKSAILVASAGNKGYPTADSGYSPSADYYPAALPYVIGVMSYDETHTLCPFSNWDYNMYSQEEYEISAPGSNIYSCYYDSAYKYMNGTSMSSGIVSGCAALLCAKIHHFDNSFSPSEITAAIMSSGINDVTFNDLYGKKYVYRRTDLYKLLSDTIKPDIIIKSDSSKENGILTYSLSNHGCNANQISLTWTMSVPGLSPVVCTEKIPDLDSLSTFTGHINLPVADQKQNINISLNVSWHNATDSTDANLYTNTFNTSVTTKPSSGSTTEIPLSGITLSPADILLSCGSTEQINVIYIPENTTDSRELTFATLNPDIATVSPAGLITAVSPGITYITAISSAGHIRQIKVTVYKDIKKNIIKKNIRLSSVSYNWTGTRRRPSVSINGLLKETDYTISYTTPDSRNIGTYHVIIKGTGKYYGKIIIPYYIKGYKGKVYTVGNFKYKIISHTSFSKKSTGKVILTGAISNVKGFKIPHYVTIGAKKYKVVSSLIH